MGKNGWRGSIPWWVLLIGAGPAVAQDQARTIDHAIELYVSDDALQGLYVRTLDVRAVGSTEVRGGVFFNEDNDLIATGDALALLGNEVNVRALELRVGTRVYGAFLAAEDEDVFSIGLGGEAKYSFGRDRSVSVTLSLFYSPDIVTFGTADNIKDASLRLMTQLQGGTDVFVGFRAFEIDFPIDREVDDNLHVGFRHSF